MTDTPIANTRIAHSPIAQSPIDSRLTIRVLDVWRKLAVDGLPRRSQIDPKEFEPDWSNCFMIDLDLEVAKSRFSYVGKSLHNFASATAERRFFSDCPEGTIHRLLLPHIQRVVEKKELVIAAGSAHHRGAVILYRTAVMPLSEIGDHIDGILAAFICREVSVQFNVPIAEIILVYGRPKLSLVR